MAFARARSGGGVGGDVTLAARMSDPRAATRRIASRPALWLLAAAVFALALGAWTPAARASFVSSIQAGQSLVLPAGDSQYVFVGSTAGARPMEAVSWSQDLAVSAAYSGNEAVSIGRSVSNSRSYLTTAAGRAIAGVGINGFAVAKTFTAHASAVGPGQSGGPETPAPGMSLELPFETKAGDVVLIVAGGQGTGSLALSGITATTLQNASFSAGAQVMASAAIYSASLPAGHHVAHWKSTTYLSNAGTSLGAVAYVLAPEEPVCVVHSLPSFMDQGEFETASSVADVVEVECLPVYAEHMVKFSATELYDSCNRELSWSEPVPYAPLPGPNFKVKLDNDGNATAVLWGGPSCAAGESTLISAHLEEAPYTTVTTPFKVLAPAPTPAGVRAEPASEVESEENSSVATIVEVEFPPVFAGRYVNIKALGLFSRCLMEPKIVWVGPDEILAATEAEELTRVKLDNDGNAFVVLLGGGSCAPGTSLIEASLEEAPYTTYTTTFKVEPPRPTIGPESEPEPEPKPAFTIEKLQRIGGEFTKSELTGKVGQTVHYEIIVTNTGEVPLKFANFSDPACTNIKGGAKELTPGQTATWTCEHKLTTTGKYINSAAVEGGDGTGTMQSNEVVVKAEKTEVIEGKPMPAFTIKKYQEIEGSGKGFTTHTLYANLGETVDYELIVTNTGNVGLTFSNFIDTRCENIAGGPGAIEVPPGGSTTWTCEHTITSQKGWVNSGTVTGTGGGKSLTHTSNQVVVYDP